VEQGFWLPKQADLAADFDIGGAEAFSFFGDLKFDFLTFLQRTVSIAFDGFMVNEHIFAAAFLFDEAEALCVVKPLNCTLVHVNESFYCRDDEIAGFTKDDRRILPKEFQMVYRDVTTFSMNCSDNRNITAFSSRSNHTPLCRCVCNYFRAVEISGTVEIDRTRKRS
jgi:hypothetical protein